MNIFGRGVQIRLRRALKFLPLVAVIISGLVYISNYKLQAAAADVSSNFTVTEAHAYKDDAETQEINETNGIGPGTSNYFKIRLKWKYESETPIADGDTVTFPLANNVATATSRLVNNPGMSKQDIIDENGEKIGEWEIKNKRVTIRFTGGAVGKNSLEGILTTPRNCYFAGMWKNDMVVPVTVGNYTLNILVPGSSMLSALGDGASKISGARTNRSVTWGFYSPSITMNELYRGEGQVALSGAARLSNMIIEDTFDESVKSISVNSISARITIPRDWLNGVHGASGWGIEASLMKFFTKKTQSAGQSFADFKASLGELEYGVYTDEETGRISFAINIGSQPSSITYAEALRMQGSANASMGQQYLSAYPFATSDTGDAIDRLTGPSNVLGGAVSLFSVSVTANYDQVSINTPVTNTATFSYDNANGDHISVQKTARSELSVGSSISEIKGEAKLYLRDVATKLPIPSAKLKLQVQDGETWIDVENGEKTTSTDGSVQVLSLDSGAKYRWVQTGYTDHYLTDSFRLYSDEAMTNVIEEFIMPENAGVTTYAVNEKESFNITYSAGEHGDFSDIVFSNQYYGATTPQPATEQIKSVAGWSFVGWNPSVDNIVTGEATYIAQWQRQTKAESVSIIWDDSNNPNDTRPDSVSVQLKQDGKDYGNAVSISADDRWSKTWSALPVYNDNGTQQHEYDAINLDTVPGYTATVGRAANGTITITFKINQHTVTTNHYLKDTTTTVADTETKTLDYGASYSTDKKILANYEYDSVSGTTSGKITGDVIVNYLYVHKTGTVTVHHYLKDSTTKVADDEVTTVNYGDTYSTSQKTNLPNHNFDTFSGTPSGTVSGDVAVIYYYTYKTGIVTTHYYIKGTTTKIADDVVETKNYTEEYATRPLESIPAAYQNYELVSDKPTDYKGIVSRPSIEVTYFYQKKDVALNSVIKISAPEIVDNKKAAIDYKIEHSANIKDYIGSVDISISMELPYPISLDESELDGGIYDKDTQTITWVVSKNHNTYTNGEVITLENNVSLVYEGAKAKDQLLATAESTITLEGKDNDAADSAETIIKTPSKIVFRYIDENGIEIQREQTENGFVGYVSDNTPPEIPGYRLIREESDLAFGEEEHVVVYRYEKMPEPVNPKTFDDSIAKYFILTGVLISGLGCGGYLISRRKA